MFVIIFFIPYPYEVYNEKNEMFEFIIILRAVSKDGRGENSNNM